MDSGLSNTLTSFRLHAAPPPPAASPPQSLSSVYAWTVRHTWLLGVLCIAVTIAAAAAAIVDMRHRTVKTYEREIAVLGRALAEQTSRYMQSLDIAMRETVTEAEAEAARAGGEAELHTRLGTWEAHERLVSRLDNLTPQDAIFIVDAEGNFIVSGRQFPPPNVTLAGADYLQYFREHDNAHLFISRARINRVTGRMCIFLARRVDTPAHRLAAVVVAAVDVATLTEFHRALNVQPFQTVTLLRQDGAVLSRYPDPSHEVGGTMAAGSPWYQLSAAGGGFYWSPGFLGGKPALVRVQPVPAYHLVVDVSVQAEAALAAWRNEATLIALAACTAVIGLLAMFWTISGSFRLQREQNAALSASRRALMEKTGLLETTLEHMDQGLMMVRPDMTVPVCNRRLMEMLDLPAAEPGTMLRFQDVLARQWPAADFTRDRSDLDAAARRALLSGPRLFEHRRADGRVLEIRSRPLPDGAVVRTYTDITDRHAALAQITALHLQAEEAVRAKSEFLANISRELRAPLNIILDRSGLIRNEVFGVVNAYLASCASDIQENAERLLSHVNDLLEVTRRDGMNYSMQDEDIILRPMLLACIAEAHAPIARANVRIMCDDLPPDVSVEADAACMHEIMRHVLSCAVTCAGYGGSVTIGVEPTRDLAVVLAFSAVKDGDARTEAQPAREAFPNSGSAALDLVMARRLLMMHGGRLTTDVYPGRLVLRAMFPGSRMIVPRLPEAAVPFP